METMSERKVQFHHHHCLGGDENYSKMMILGRMALVILKIMVTTVGHAEFGPHTWLKTEL